MRIIAFLVIIYSIASILFSWWHFSSYRKVQLEAHQNQQLLVAQNTINKIDRFLQSQIIMLNVLASNISDESENQKLNEERLKELHLNSGTWESIVTTNVEGKIISTTNPTLKGNLVTTDSELVENFISLKSGQQSYTDQFNSKLLKKPTMAIIIPLRDETKLDNPLIGAIVGYISWPVLEETLNQSDGESILVTANGRFIGANESVKALNIFPLSSEIVTSEYLRQNQGSRSISGNESLFKKTSYQTIVPQLGFGNFKGNNWYILTEKSVADLYGDSNRSLLLETLIFTLMVFVILFVIYFILNYLDGKIKKRFRKSEMMDI